ncbi:MAG: glycosyltransferase family 9 protein [Candidatus Pacebacteria bacterium]|nr:glycosyltransferase family 9 protein [Candidatus Paceibacterota bacterium]
MKFNPKNLIYFQNGSIGDFLMTIFFLENIYLNNNSIKLNVIVSKNEKLLLQFLEKYPYINLILVNKRSFKGLLGVFKLLKFLFSSNLVITAPTPGILSLWVKILAKKISFLSKSELVGFEDGQKINKFIYSKLLNYNTNVIYPEFLKEVIKKIGFKIEKETPELKYISNESVLKKLNLEERNYIVLHPIATTKGRSFKEKEIIDLIKVIKGISPHKKIILTGGNADKDILNIISMLFENDVFVMISPKISELCTIINGAKLFIGVDTGTTHIASFLQKKSLIVAINGTPNWLPYYNPNARILYSVDGCIHSLYEGREHLEGCRGERLRCLGDVPLEVVEKTLKELLI